LSELTISIGEISMPSRIALGESFEKLRSYLENQKSKHRSIIFFMYLNQYKNSLKTPLNQRTMCFLIKNEKVLLGIQQTGFNQGKILGIGGVLEEEETLEHAVMRQCQEEIGITPTILENAGTLGFYFQKDPTPEIHNQQVNLFLCREWIGEIEKNNEMEAQWYGFEQIPFEKMQTDAKMWLAQALEAGKIEGEFLFDANLQVEEYNFKHI